MDNGLMKLGKRIILFFIFILLINIVLAIETKEDANYKVTFLIGSGVTTNYSGIKVSSITGERGVANYTDIGYLIQRGILYVLNLIDIKAPTISNLRNTSTTNESSFIEWSCNENCNYSILWFNNSIRNNTYLVDSIYNNTFKTSHNPYLANLTNSTTYFINLTVWDGSDNSATDNTFNFTTAANILPDITPPTYSNFANNASSITKIDGVVNWSIDLVDTGGGLSFYIFAHNQSGTLTNVSNGTLSGTSAFVNKTVTITKAQGNYICGQFWVNDTSGNVNQTLLTETGACFTVTNTAPDAPTIIYPVDGKNYSNITAINYSSGDADGDSLTYSIYINNTLNNTRVDANLTQWNASDGFYNLTVTANDGTDSSANSTVTHFRLDTIAPSWSGNETNATLVNINGNAAFNITISDYGSGLSYYIFSWNGTGSWDNATNGSISGNSIKLVINKTVTSSGSIIGYKWYANDSAGNWNESLLRTFTLANTAPTILYVESGISANPIEDGTTTVYFTFNASDVNGASDIDVSKASVNITLNAPGGQSRANTSCTNISTSGNVVQFNCSVKFYYYDNSSSSWIINATIYDNSNAIGINDSVIFTYNSLSAMKLARANLTFSNLYFGAQDKPADSPITLNNTGNFDFTKINITAYDLVGMSDPAYKIGIGNFSVNITNDTAGAGLQLQNATSLLVPGAILAHKLGDAATNANETLYFWLDVPNSSQIMSQDYNSTTPWRITVE